MCIIINQSKFPQKKWHSRTVAKHPQKGTKECRDILLVTEQIPIQVPTQSVRDVYHKKHL